MRTRLEILKDWYAQGRTQDLWSTFKDEYYSDIDFKDMISVKNRIRYIREQFVII